MSRYSRLKALEEYGYNVDWNDLKSKTIAIAGVGGVANFHRPPERVPADEARRQHVLAMPLLDRDFQS